MMNWCWSCRPRTRWRKINKVSVSQLAGQRFVGYERDIATRKASDRILREYGVKPHYTMEFDNIETIKRAVEIGQGMRHRAAFDGRTRN